MRIQFALPLFLTCVLLAGSPIHASDLALVGARIYPSRSELPIENGSILVHHGHIVAVGPTATIKVPQDATAIDCKGLVVTAGFWNSHPHILTPGLLHAEKLSPKEVASQLQEMLTRWGFTTVFDIASVLQNDESHCSCKPSFAHGTLPPCIACSEVKYAMGAASRQAGDAILAGNV